jgi:Tfp pilus assembly protein PilF
MRTYSVLLLATIIVCASFVAPPAQAQTPTTKPTNVAPLTSSQAQVDGIVSRVVDNLWEQADHYFHNGDYNRIIGLCRVMVETDPSFNDAYDDAAYLLWSQGDTKGADDFLQYGVKHSTDKMSVLFEFGSHLMRTKRPQAALPYLQRAAAMPNAGPLVYTQLGHCYEQNKKIKEAIETWEIVVKKFPTFPSGPKNLAAAKKLAAGG